ncbi:hypothetical protein SETIT_2G191500v2 [Setaria italica]|uniref:Uncharacterized protein n=1 Tax=Setaria italica TaxID=4555 RepID=K4A1W2_SETIT|nr:uncharacterized protein LOC101765606 [Setaria italica]RCV11509.1 hypothetical protein SETIT_2G191500v2 [Setaria italica]
MAQGTTPSTGGAAGGGCTSAPAVSTTPPGTPRASAPAVPPQPPSSVAVGYYYAVELYFDPALENQVLKAWNALARRQLGTRLIDAAARPHLALLHLPAAALPPPGTGAGGDPLIRLGPSLRALASRLDPLPLALSSLAALPASASSPNDNVLFLAPTPSAALLGLHAQLCELLRKDAGVEVPDAFRPDHWVPRCAVAVDVPRGRMAEAFCVLRELKLLPVSGYGMDIALVEVGAVVRELVSYPLGGSGGAGAD